MISIDQFKRLKSSTCDVSPFTFQGQTKFGKVIHVYDGDTCKINLFIKDDLYRFTVRLKGYDSPEMKSHDPLEKCCAGISKKALSDLILDRVVLLKCFEFDKYGRLLCQIFIRDEQKHELVDVNDYMIKHKLGYSYHGEKKQAFNQINFESHEHHIQIRPGDVDFETSI